MYIVYIIHILCKIYSLHYTLYSWLYYVYCVLYNIKMKIAICGSNLQAFGRNTISRITSQDSIASSNDSSANEVSFHPVTVHFNLVTINRINLLDYRN